MLSTAQSDKMMSSIAESLRKELSAERQALLEEVHRAQDELYQTNDRVISLMQALIGGFAVLIALLGAGAIWEALKIERMREEAKELLQQATRIVEVAKENSDYISGVKESLALSLVSFEQVYKDLPKLEKTWIVGTERTPIDPAHRVIFEDVDHLVVTADRLNLFPDGKEIVEGLTRLAQYWKVHGDFYRASARASRAIELDSGSYAAHLELASIRAERAVTETMTVDHKNELLRRALESVDEARKINRRHTSKTAYFAAWLYDEQAEYARAIRKFRDAIKLDAKEARSEGREPDHLMTYDLACSFAKKGDFNQALDVLDRVIDKSWQYIAEDRDFDRLRESREHAERLNEMINRFS